MISIKFRIMIAKFWTSIQCQGRTRSKIDSGFFWQILLRPVAIKCNLTVLQIPIRAKLGWGFVCKQTKQIKVHGMVKRTISYLFLLHLFKEQITLSISSSLLHLHTIFTFLLLSYFIMLLMWLHCISWYQ